MSDTKSIRPLKFGALFRYFLWDIILMFVLVINLLLIFWDWIFSIPTVFHWFQANTDRFFGFYNHIHQHIREIDLMFIAIYIIDVVIGWGISVFVKKEKVFKYPFTHWYDLLGCVPSGSFVFIRLLRIVSIIIRLYKRNLIDIENFFIVKRAFALYNIVMEEISDRVVLNILFGIKQNVVSGMPITKLVFSKIVEPQKQKIIDLVFKKIGDVAKKEYPNYKPEIANYVKTKSKEAIESNSEIKKLSMIPVVGNQIKNTIEKSISDTIMGVVDNVVGDLLSQGGQDKLKSVSEEVSDSVLKDLEKDLQPIITEIIIAVVEIIAKTANVKQWKLAEIRTKITKIQNSPNPDLAKIDELEQEYNSLMLKELDLKWDDDKFKKSKDSGKNKES